MSAMHPSDRPANVVSCTGRRLNRSASCQEDLPKSLRCGSANAIGRHVLLDGATSLFGGTRLHSRGCALPHSAETPGVLAEMRRVRRQGGADPTLKFRIVRSASWLHEG